MIPLKRSSTPRVLQLARSLSQLLYTTRNTLLTSGAVAQFGDTVNVVAVLLTIERNWPAPVPRIRYTAASVSPFTPRARPELPIVFALKMSAPIAATFIAPGPVTTKTLVASGGVVQFVF